MTIISLGDAKYITLETFKKNGNGVKTPVWVTPENSKLYVITDADSWKVKRIRRNGWVKVAESDARGTVSADSQWFGGQARILDGSEAVARQNERIAAKYGWMFRAYSWMTRLLGREQVRCVIEISPSPGDM